jgi:hypothetical protein
VLVGERLHAARPGLQLAVELRRDRAGAQDLRAVARRPDTQATIPKRLATSISGRRVVSGMWASSGCSTIGASTPSTSSRTAQCAGSSRSGRSSSSMVASGTPVVCPPMHRTLRLAVVGTAAGVFSGLFGVGGGTVMVPLLVLWLAYGEREATGTSLGAIVFIASAAVVVQAIYGNVHVREGVLVGIPAVGGVVAGTALQQRVPQRALSLVFAALLVVTAITLLV